MRSNTPWAFYDPDSSSLRTSAPSLLDGPDSTWSSLDLPASGSMLNGRVYVRPMLAPRTGGNGGSSLPTPEASDGSGGRVSTEMGGTRPSGAKRAITLATAVKHQLLPTPVAHEPGGTLEDYHSRLRKADGREPTFVPLSMVANLLPTPTVQDASNAANRTATRSNPDSKHHDGTTLVDATRLLPTPTSRDWKGENQRRDETCLPGAIRGASTPTPSPDGQQSLDDPHLDQLTIEDA